MVFFYLSAAALVALALGLLLRPLVKRPGAAALSRDHANAALFRDQLAEIGQDQARGLLSEAQAGEARREVEQRLAEDLESSGGHVGNGGAGMSRAVVWAVAVGVPLLAVGLYAWLGNPGALDPAKRLGMTEEQAAERNKILDLTARLAARLQAQPEDPQGWVMLAKTYRALEKIPEAARAFERAVALNPGNAELHADAAEVIAMLQRGRFTGEPAKLAARALELDAKNEKALALLGTAAYESKDFPAAIRYWQRLLALAPPESEFARAVEGGIAKAKLEMARPAEATVKVSGRVQIDPAVAAGAQPGDAVFVFAKAAKGPPMPLAVLRRQVKDLPFDFVLDDTMAMAPGMTLAAFGEVMVGARISKRGNAMPASGDLEGSVGPVAPGTTGLDIRIDRRIP